MSDQQSTNPDAELSQAERIARDLRAIADGFESLAGTTLDRLYVSMNVQPRPAEPFDNGAVIDAVGMAVLAIPGQPQEMSNGSWHHAARGCVGEVQVAVFGSCPNPNGTPEEREIKRLRAALLIADARLAAVTGVKS